MHAQGNSFQSIEIVNTKFDMDLLEKVRHLIEEEKYNTLAKLGKCALMSTESQLFEDLITTSKIQKDDPCLDVKIDEWVFVARYISKPRYFHDLVQVGDPSKWPFLVLN